MTDVFRFAVIGLGAGSLYALAAVGLVLVYRGSKVVNFAQGVMGMMAAYVFYEVHQNWHVTDFLAIPAGLLTSAALGAAFFYLVIRRLRDASNLIKVVATLALLLVTQEAVLLIFGASGRPVSSILPTNSVKIFGAPVGEDRLCIFGIVIVLTALLWAVYKYTEFGLATSAVAENPTAAAALAISPDLIAIANWAIGAALGGLAAIFLVPITSLSSENLSLIVIPILAAAVVGGFSSFPITTIAGLALGIAQSEVTRYVSSPGWSTAVPFIFVTVILYLRGRSIAGKEEAFGRVPSVGSGRVPPYLVGIAVVVSLLCIWIALPFDWLVAMQYEMLFAIVLLSLVVVTGYAGQVSLAQMGMAGIGALISAWLYSSHHFPFLLAALLGIVATVPVGAVIAAAGVRTRGAALAIVTLGLAFSLEAVIFTNQNYTGGLNGYNTGTPSIFGLGVAGLEHPKRFATLTLIVLVGLGLMVANLRRGRAGRRLIAVRTNERAAAAMGISVSGAKTYAFVLAGMIAAAGGVLFAFFLPTPDFTNFVGLSSISVTETAVLGGVGHLGGPLIASGYQPNALPTQLFSFLGGNVATYLIIIAGALLLVFLPSLPNGMSAEAERQNARWLAFLRRRVPTRPRPTIVASARSTARSVAPKSLRLEGVSVRFGGTLALDRLSLEVAPGQVLGLIGPNGAGKTTAIDAITGFVKTSSGRICLGDENIDGWTPERRARAGLARSFQSLELFDDLSVEENVLAASDRRDRRAYLTDLFHPGGVRLVGLAGDAVSDFGLEGRLSSQARHLSYAQRRLLAVARAVAGGGSVLLLDEPAAGLGSADATVLSDTIRRLACDLGIAVVLIEHNVDMVLRTCDQIVALNFGEMIGQGTPAEIRRNQAVVAAYLGAAHADEDDGRASLLAPTAPSPPSAPRTP
jgi:ABC-type branched-subunit amino acid transport system ATPase component/branched-subunit amino acid ABC-type transport system permease component